MRRIWLDIAVALLASTLSYAAWCLPEDVAWKWGPGLVFGVLVLAPSERGLPQRVGLILSSVGSYRGAVWCADLCLSASWPIIAACAFAGAVGAAALALASSGLLRVRPHKRSFSLGVLTGTIGGLFFGFGIHVPDGSILQDATFLLGFAVWQVGYTVSHRLHPWVGVI